MFDAKIQPMVPACRIEERHGHPTLVFEQFKTGLAWMSRGLTHVERATYLANRISECIYALIQVNMGCPANYYEFEEEIVSDTFKNGRKRKVPVVRTNEVESGGRGSEAREKLLLEMIRRINELADLNTDDSWRKRNLKARAHMIRYMAFNSPLPNDLLVTVRPHPKNSRGLCYDAVWAFPTDIGATGCRNSILFPEIMEFFPGTLLDEYRDRLSEFQWVFRDGFCEEFHCPFDYWQRTRFLHQIVDLQQNPEFTWTISMDDDPPQEVLLHWTNYPCQPIKQVVFTDEGMKGMRIPTTIYDYSKWDSIKKVLPPSIRTIQPEGQEVNYFVRTS